MIKPYSQENLQSFSRLHTQVPKLCLILFIMSFNQALQWATEICVPGHLGMAPTFEKECSQPWHMTFIISKQYHTGLQYFLLSLG